MKENINLTLLNIFDRLYKFYGPQHWWPAEGSFEVMVGAILTQSAAWTNVEKAISNLKNAAVLTPSALRAISSTKLADLLHPCGYYNMKTRKLKALSEWLGKKFDDDLGVMNSLETNTLRDSLLGIYGVGEETADSILLYACDKPVFVIDSYTRRIVERLGLNVGGKLYSDYQRFFMKSLKSDLVLFNEFHALLVAVAKSHCRKEPICSGCCLLEACNKKIT